MSAHDQTFWRLQFRLQKGDNEVWTIFKFPKDALNFISAMGSFSSIHVMLVDAAQVATARAQQDWGGFPLWKIVGAGAVIDDQSAIAYLNTAEHAIAFLGTLQHGRLFFADDTTVLWDQIEDGPCQKNLRAALDFVQARLKGWAL